ncbi:MAG TPA: 3-deoxy-7-phosphoheptulonate synthase class II [Allosphingosinicella sp.]|nr:3-deoxy-7-phosphoheptulonate synthase class II [Allosphingosinicella sp.]
MAKDWTPASWRMHEARHQPVYADADALDSALRELAAYPPLVPAAEAHALKAQLADAQSGRAFLLQGGDCAESFAEFSTETIRGTARLIEAMAGRLAAASGLPIVRVGRIAGQFAKPRSRELERKDGRDLPMYRGDIVNGLAFDETARRPDPERMFRAYGQSAAALSHLRACAGPEPIYTSHEGLLLPYEQALTRRDGAGWYGSSAHFLWVGDRTRFAGSAHVEYLRGLTNPIGIKCGPTLAPDALLGLLETLNPGREAGRITLVGRMGVGEVERALPPLLRAVAAEGHPVLWTCDPMHGNTERTASGYKTRPLGRILGELRAFFAAARAEGVRGGGIHVEMTGRDVTECTGGADPVTEEDLAARYHTHCDPRLNRAQAMEVAELVAAELARERGAKAA